MRTSSLSLAALLLLLPACPGNGDEGTGSDANSTSGDLSPTTTDSETTTNTILTVSSSDFTSGISSSTDPTTSSTDPTATTAADKICGDSEVNGDEECDDGNEVNDDLCSNACKLAVCGDGVSKAKSRCESRNDSCRRAAQLRVA